MTKIFKSWPELFSHPRLISDVTFRVSVAFRVVGSPLMVKIPNPSITKKSTSNGFLCSANCSRVLIVNVQVQQGFLSVVYVFPTQSVLSERFQGFGFSLWCIINMY